MYLVSIQSLKIHTLKPKAFTLRKDEPFVEPDELVAESSGKVVIETNQKPFWVTEQVEVIFTNS